MRCDRKARFRSRKIAGQVAHRWAKELDEPIHPYHCLTHHCWHIGHPVGWQPSPERVARLRLGSALP